MASRFQNFHDGHDESVVESPPQKVWWNLHHRKCGGISTTESVVESPPQKLDNQLLKKILQQLKSTVEENSTTVKINC